jgi:hypothetical protein
LLFQEVLQGHRLQAQLRNEILDRDVVALGSDDQWIGSREAAALDREARAEVLAQIFDQLTHHASPAITGFFLARHPRVAGLKGFRGAVSWGSVSPGESDLR